MFYSFLSLSCFLAFITGVMQWSWFAFAYSHSAIGLRLDPPFFTFLSSFIIPFSLLLLLFLLLDSPLRAAQHAFMPPFTFLYHHVLHDTGIGFLYEPDRQPIPILSLSFCFLFVFSATSTARIRPSLSPHHRMALQSHLIQPHAEPKRRQYILHTTAPLVPAIITN